MKGGSYKHKLAVLIKPQNERWSLQHKYSVFIKPQNEHVGEHSGVGWLYIVCIIVNKINGGSDNTNRWFLQNEYVVLHKQWFYLYDQVYL